MIDHQRPIDHRPAFERTGTSSLVELLDRVLDGGVVVDADIIIALAGVDLLRLDLRLLLAPMDEWPHLMV